MTMASRPRRNGVHQALIYLQSLNLSAYNFFKKMHSATARMLDVVMTVLEGLGCIFKN